MRFDDETGQLASACLVEQHQSSWFDDLRRRLRW
jgi:hypothetical protein